MKPLYRIEQVIAEQICTNGSTFAIVHFPTVFIQMIRNLVFIDRFLQVWYQNEEDMKTRTCFSWYAFNLPDMKTFLEQLDFYKCPGTSLLSEHNNKRKCCVFLTMHCFQWNILYRWSCGLLVNQEVIPILHFMCFITNNPWLPVWYVPLETMYYG